MSIRSLLLRLFLGLVLVLNGTATAMAAVHMNHVDILAAASSGVASTAIAGGEGEASCHDADQKKVATAHPDSGGHLQESLDTGTPSPNCCESGICSCACVHPAQAATVDPVIGLVSIEHSGSVRPMFSVHASPALPHLIRPPIG